MRVIQKREITRKAGGATIIAIIKAPKKADELFLREDLQLIKYPTEIQKIPRVNFRKSKVEKAKKTREQLDEEKKEEEKDPEILDETIEVGRRPRRKAKPEDVNNPDNFIGKRVRRKH